MTGQESKYEKYEELKKKAELGGGRERIEKHHGAGKNRARERTQSLFDPDFFFEFDKLVTQR